MAKFLKLSKAIINLDCVQAILFVPEPLAASIFLASGCEELVVDGEDTLILMDAIDNLLLADAFISTQDASLDETLAGRKNDPNS